MNVFEACTAGIRQMSMHPFFDREDPALSTWGVVWWWEKRRPVFNLAVGATGIFTCIVFLVGGFVSKNRIGEAVGLPALPVVAFFEILAYGVVANVLYTGAWFVELSIQHVWGPPGRDFPRIALTLGLLFSIIVTLVPAAIETVLVVLAVAVGSLLGK